MTDVPDLETSVADWIIERPAAQRIFEEHGIEYSCAGKSLRYACEQRGIDPRQFLQLLDVATARSTGE